MAVKLFCSASLCPTASLSAALNIPIVFASDRNYGIAFFSDFSNSSLNLSAFFRKAAACFCKQAGIKKRKPCHNQLVCLKGTKTNFNFNVSEFGPLVCQSDVVGNVWRNVGVNLKNLKSVIRHDVHLGPNANRRRAINAGPVRHIRERRPNMPERHGVRIDFYNTDDRTGLRARVADTQTDT